MVRFLAALAIALGFLSAAQANIAGADKKAVPGESRQKIIDQVKTDLEKVLDRLNAADPGAETRAAQERILKGLDELLKQQNPDRSKSLPPAGNPPPRPSSKPGADPQPAAGEPTPTPAKSQHVQAQPTTGEHSKATVPNTPDEVRKETPGGSWPPLPPRHRAAIDSLGRSRFVPGYREILREYYRSLAQSSRSSD